eukprot:gene32737-42392_t
MNLLRLSTKNYRGEGRSDYTNDSDSARNDENYVKTNLRNQRTNLILGDIDSPVPLSLSIVEIDTVQRIANPHLGFSSNSHFPELESSCLSEAKIIPQKAVSFCRTVRVCLVPSRNCLAPYCQDLFWSPDDYQTFKDEAIYEIKSALVARRRVGDNCSPRNVKNALYQPTVYPDLSQSLLTPEETKSEGGTKMIVNLESDFKAEVLHSSSVDKSVPEAPATVIKNTYRGQPTPTQQHQYAYPYQLHQQYPQEQGVRYHSAYTENDAATTAIGGASGRRQLDLAIIPAILA